MLSGSFFSDIDPFNYPQRYNTFRFRDVNNNIMDCRRQTQYENAERMRRSQIENLRRAQMARQRQQHFQNQEHRRPVVYRPKPFETTIDVSNVEQNKIQ